MNASNFVKIGDWRKQPDEVQDAFLCRGKLWLIGKKFLDQPTYHWGHHVVFGGASSDCFEPANGEWCPEGPKLFSALASEEHLGEVLFLFADAIFLLLFSKFGPLNVHSLHQFDVESRQWREVLDFPGKSAKVPSEESYKNSLIPVDGPGPNGLYFISYSDHQIRVHSLEFGRAGPTKWTDIGVEVPADVVQQLQPTQAVHADGVIHVLGGVHGCGFRWQPNQLIRIRLGQKMMAEFVEIGHAEGEPRPSFTYNGPLAHAIVPSKGVWLHFAGNNAVGLGGSTFNGQIWALANLEGQPSWEKLALEVPKPAGAHASNLHIVFDGESGGQLLVAHEELGILRAKLDI